MRIGEVAARAAVKVQTLRYYEQVGLLPEPTRSASGYRAYDIHAVRRVRFIKRAQELGFTLAEIANLLAFRDDAGRSCAQVEARATATVDRITEKIHDLERMRVALSRYVAACQTREPVSECPLLTALETDPESSA